VYNVTTALVHGIDDVEANNQAVENAGFGNHVWDIEIGSIPQLLYWCSSHSLNFYQLH
jgi:hypothetical protein